MKYALGARPVILGFQLQGQAGGKTAGVGKDGYPPYNVERISDNRYRVSLAVAGFAEEDLSVVAKNGELVIAGARSTDEQADAKRVFLHRGIAARQFRKVFGLGENVEVTGARLENGLLHVDLERHEPERVSRRIKITRG